MQTTVGGLIATHTRVEHPQISLRMLSILENIDNNFELSNVVIVDKVDAVYYTVVNGKQIKEVIPV